MSELVVDREDDGAPPEEGSPGGKRGGGRAGGRQPAGRRARRGRRRTALYGAVAAGVVLAAFVGVLGTRKGAKDQQARSPLLGQPAPPIVGSGVTNAGRVDLGAFRGKYVLVNFFASWCVPCQDEQPQLVRWEKESTSHAVVGVLFTDTPGAARAYLQANGGDWPVLADPDGQVALNYGVRGPPESYLVNPDGIVLAKYVGEVTASGLDQLVARAQAAAA